MAENPKIPHRASAIVPSAMLSSIKRWIKPPTNMLRLLLVIIAVSAVAGFYASGGNQWLSWESLRRNLDPFRRQVQSHPLASASVFMALYVGASALSLPVATGLTLMAGALFGRVVGTIVVSLGSTLGATLAMLSSRYVLADRVRERFGDRLNILDEGIARDGPFYLFLLRLVPAFPFVLINLGMGLTRMKPLTFALTSAAGMLPATILYVNAGAELAAIERPGQILSPRVIAAFVLLGLVPLLLRKILGRP